MFVKSYKISGGRLLGAGVIFLAAIALFVYGVGARISSPQGESEVEVGAKLDKNAAKGVAKTERDRLAFIAQFGWEVEEEPQEIAEIVIPEEFDEVYIKYNELQQKQNYNLEKFKGKRCKRYTYKITNYPECPDNARINLLVCDGKVIGGDVCSVELNGFMHGFAADSSAMAQAQTLPLPETEETAVVEDTIGGETLPAEEAAEAEGVELAEDTAADPSAEPPVQDTMDQEMAEMMEILQGISDEE